MDRRDFLAAGAQGAAAFGILRYATACAPRTRAGSPAPAAAADAAAPAGFPALRDRYFLQVLQFNPVISTYLGGDGYSPALADVNGRLRDYTAAGLERERAFYRDVQAELERVPRAEGGSAAAIDQAVLAAQVRFLLHELDELRLHERAVDTYVAEPFRGVDWQIQQMEDAGNGLLGTEGEWDLVVRRVAAVPAYLAAARANLLAGKQRGNLPDRRLVQLDGIEGSDANAEYFRTTLPKTAAGYLGARPFAAATLERLRTAGEAAARAWSDFSRFLGQTYDLHETVDRFPAGEREYEWRVRNNLHVQRSAAELWEYGAAQVALYEGKIYAVAEEIARGANLTVPFGTAAEQRAGVRAVMAHLGKDAPKNDEELFRWYRETAARLVQYGRDQGLFDVPADYKLDIVPTPPVLQSTIDAAYYPAPPFKKTGVGRFYLSPTHDDPAVLAQNPRASVADLCAHEGFPGHDWHFKYMTQHAREISNIRWLTPGSVEDSSSMWEDSMAAEGWGLYAEELMAQPVAGRPYGVYSAAEYLYMLQGQLMRAVRVRVDVGIHTGRMTFDQAVDYFTEHFSFYPNACAQAASDPAAKAICDAARRAIYRYSKWPTQAITYNLGKNEIVQLREAYRREQGATYSQKEFHERLMRQGTIPAGYFREAFLRA
ncbi:MAG TPA: DUF885 domain-containing protein [Gemmatimonadales bacterium]|nr:DUF885 domain-containing protein [Gemmatimonadales bacterium]